MEKRRLGIFRDKTVIVTGAASGIGRTSAYSFAIEGARVVVADINEEGANQCVAEIKNAGGAASAVICDVTCESSICQMFECVKKELGGVHVCVNSAGMLLIRGAREATGVEWARSFASNATAAALCSRYAAESMRSQGGGAIVVVASISASKAEPGFATYSSSKAALLMLMRSMAIEYGRWNIRVNAVSPGPVDTPGLREIIRSEKVEWDSWKASVCRLQCIPTMVSAQDVAKAILFLSSEAACSITGANLPVDGGLLARAFTL